VARYPKILDHDKRRNRVRDAGLLRRIGANSPTYPEEIFLEMTGGNAFCINRADWRSVNMGGSDSDGSLGKS
jgi:hypothetical protein